jgi:hypothetical protein
MSPENGSMPRGDTGRTFSVSEPAVTAALTHVSPPSGVLHVSTSKVAATSRER